MHNCRRVA